MDVRQVEGEQLSAAREESQEERCAKRPLQASVPEPLDLLAKKRRKQLNPSRITMVQVPRHTPGLDIEVDSRNEPVPITEPSPVSTISPQSLPASPNAALVFPFMTPLWGERSLKIFNYEAFCELCNKEFCNKYFLKTHKANKHGIYIDMKQVENGRYVVRRYKNKDYTTVQTDSTNETGSTLAKVDEPLALHTREEEEEEEQKSPLNLMMSGGEEEKEDKEEKEVKQEKEDKEDKEDCSSENLEKIQTMLLRLTPSEVLENTDSSESRDSKLEEGVRSRQKTNPTSSYCEICNKELCNKYFMRTHMQRMHGIELESGTQIGGVVCNICNKELCSKYFLRVHKQNTHGVSLLGVPSTSNMKGARPATTCCHVCNKRFRSAKWLQAHLLSDHQESSEPPDNPQPPETLISKLFWENTSSSSSFTCSQCPFTTSVLAFLFVHERSHYVLSNTTNTDPVKPSETLQELIHDKTFWQHKITQQLPECLDLSLSNAKFLDFDRNGS